MLSVTDMSNLFRNANNFDQNLNSWDVSSEKFLYGTFAGAVSHLINHIWDVSNATILEGCFMTKSISESIGN